MNQLVRVLNGYTATLFQTAFSAFAKEYYEKKDEAGDHHARYYLEFLQAKESADFDKLAEFVPDNWFDLYLEEYEKILPQYKQVVLNGMAAMVLGKAKICSTDEENLFYEKLGREFNKTPAEVKKINLEIIEVSTRTKLFITLFGDVFPKDDSGEPMIPSPFLAKFLGKSRDEVSHLVEEFLPFAADFYPLLSKICDIPCFNFSLTGV